MTIVAAGKKIIISKKWFFATREVQHSTAYYATMVVNG